MSTALNEKPNAESLPVSSGAAILQDGHYLAPPEDKDGKIWARTTGGIRNNFASELLEDVFTINDFDFPLWKSNHPAYLNTEFVGHTFPTKMQDNVARVREHTLRHARIHDQLASDAQYAGGLGWCAFDYNTHADFGSGDRICYHGVSDIFRDPKPVAGFYKSQCTPAEEIVIEPAFSWAEGDESSNFTEALVCSNCDHLKFFIAGRLAVECDPDHNRFPYLPYPPFTANLSHVLQPWGDLKIEGYIGGKKVAEKMFAGDGVIARFEVIPDDRELIADGADVTRVVLRAVDRFGNRMSFATVALGLRLEGPATLIGDNPFALAGGTGAVWIRTKEQAGEIRLSVTHPRLGMKEIAILSVPCTTEIY